jgi:hypothetical protein
MQVIGQGLEGKNLRQLGIPADYNLETREDHGDNQI